jgi:hypothetical protein
MAELQLAKRFDMLEGNRVGLTVYGRLPLY